MIVGVFVEFEEDNVVVDEVFVLLLDAYGVAPVDVVATVSNASFWRIWSSLAATAAFASISCLFFTMAWYCMACSQISFYKQWRRKYQHKNRNWRNRNMLIKNYLTQTWFRLSYWFIMLCYHGLMDWCRLRIEWRDGYPWWFFCAQRIFNLSHGLN